MSPIEPKHVTFNRRVFEARAEEFEKLDVTKLTPDELYEELMWVVATTATRREERVPVSLPVRTDAIPPGTLLWRARALASDDHVIPLRGMNSTADAWEPPARFVARAGRLNKPNESLLYTCLDNPRAAPLEIGASDGERFSLIKYRVTRALSLTAIGLPTPPTHPSHPPIEGGQLISDFFARQFSRTVGTSEHGEYHLAELVVKYNYDLPPHIHDGWLYPSTKVSGPLNVTLRPGPAHAKLELVGVAICKFDSTSVSFSGWAFSDGRNSPDHLAWFAHGSEVQSSLFPEFT